MTMNINQISEIISYYEQGYSIRDTAKKMRCDKNTVQKYINMYKKNHQFMELISQVKNNTYMKKNYVRYPEEDTGLNHLLRAESPPSLQQNELVHPPENKSIETQNKEVMKTISDLEEITRKKYQEDIFRKQQEKEKQIANFLVDFDQNRWKNEDEFRKKKAELHKQITIEAKNLHQQILANQVTKNDLSTIIRKALDKKKKEEQKNQEMMKNAQQIHPHYVAPQKIEQKSESEKDKNAFDELLPIIYLLVDITRKNLDFNNSPYASLPKNSPTFLDQYSKYMQKKYD